MRTSHITQYLTSMAGLICLAIYLCVLAPYTSPLYASESIRREARFDVAFPINSFKVERDFGTNAAVLDSLAELITAVRDESTYIELKEIGLNGTASPDGRLTSNLRLADRRMRSLRDYIVANYDIPNSVIILKEASVPWDEFREMIKDEPRLLHIVSKGSDDSWLDAGIRMDRLKALDGGAVWRRLARDVFPQLRRSVVMTVVIETLPEPAPAPGPESESCEYVYEEAVEAEVVEEAVEAAPEPVPAARCHRSWHASTNVLAWTLGMTNLMGEYDFGCHWSVALSLYYSAWNYAKATRKFRAFIFRPELRWWPGEGHRGLFVDGHIQMAAYNFALPGWEYRIQDVGGRHPALGGGIGVGYRLPLGRSGRWAAEAAIGAGVYHLEYNRFVNEENGALVDRRERTFFGLDNVSVSVVYNFNAFGR